MAAPTECAAILRDATFRSLLRMRSSRSRSSQIQHQPVGLAAGAADHDAPVFGLLFFGEDGVAVLGSSGNHPLLAGAANPELAGIIDVDTLIEQDFENRPALRNEKFLVRTRELDGESALLGGFGPRREILWSVRPPVDRCE